MRVFLSFLLVLLALAAGIAYLSMFIVNQNEQALVLRFGEPKAEIQTPGLSWKAPFIDTVEYFDKRILDLDTTPQQLTASDQKRLVVDTFTRYRITNPLKFYKTIRDERNVRSRLGPIVEASLRRVLGAATFKEVVRDKREELMKRIAKQVNDEGVEFGLEVVDVRIKRADLPPENSKSVFDRMGSERQREAADIRAQGSAEAVRIRATAERQATVLRAEAQQKAEILRGTGDATKARLFADAYNQDPEFSAFYQSLQAYEKALKGGETRLVISPNSDTFKDFFRYFQEQSPPAQKK